VRAEAAEPPEPRKVGGRRRDHRRGRASSRREIFLEKVKKTHLLISKNGKIPLHSNTRSRTPRSRTTSQKPRQSSRSPETPAKKRERKKEANPQNTEQNKNFSRIIKREKLETLSYTTPNAYELKRHDYCFQKKGQPAKATCEGAPKELKSTKQQQNIGEKRERKFERDFLREFKKEREGYRVLSTNILFPTSSCTLIKKWLFVLARLSLEERERTGGGRERKKNTAEGRKKSSGSLFR